MGSLGFLGQFFLFRDALMAGPRENLYLFIYAVTMSMVAVAFYLRPVVAMYFRDPPADADTVAPLLRSPTMNLALVVVTLVVLWLGIAPGRALSAAKRRPGPRSRRAPPS